MKVVLREATPDDWEIMLKWHNDPEIYSLQNGHIITWDEHLTWLRSLNKNCHIFIVHAGDSELQKVGVIKVDRFEDREPEVSCYIGEKSLWGLESAKRPPYKYAVS